MFRKVLFFAMAVLALASCGKKEQDLKPITAVSFSDVRINDDFWSQRLSVHLGETIPLCIDQIENQTGRIRNFENAAKGEGEHSGIFFDDSDVYKALEGMAYSYQISKDPFIMAKCDEWIDKFAAAQQPDGYLNTYYILTGLDKRWTDIDKHEMYCAGHMIEAAVAYYKASGKRKLLDVSEKMVAHMMSVFGPDKRHWVPGHEEIELALVKLFEVTGKKEYLDFAAWLLDQRGHGYGAYVGRDEKYWKEHYQDEYPVRELSRISGHAVRAMYLYCGMADVAAYTGDTQLIDALNRLWDHVVMRNMYITGGIGQSARNEGITQDYDLPNKEAYCETCASVGMVFWNQRMFQFTGDGKYADVVERSLYNGTLAGVSLSGRLFFYVNPLESDGNHHRQRWYGCACCPSQICRFIPSIGNYIYGISKEGLWVSQYISNTAKVKIKGQDVKLKLESQMPVDGHVMLTLGLGKSLKTDVRLRIPAWCKDYTIAINGQIVSVPEDKGYAVLYRKWSDGDQVEMILDMPVELVAADPRVKQNVGKRAIQRGALVYCLEEVDNPVDFDNLSITENADFSLERLNLKEGFGYPLQRITATTPTQTLRFVPYLAWDNRAPGKMKVWIPLSE